LARHYLFLIQEEILNVSVLSVSLSVAAVGALKYQAVLCKLSFSFSQFFHWC